MNGNNFNHNQKLKKNYLYQSDKIFCNFKYDLGLKILQLINEIY